MNCCGGPVRDSAPVAWVYRKRKECKTYERWNICGFGGR